MLQINYKMLAGSWPGTVVKTVSKKEAKERNTGRLMRKAAEVLSDREWTRGKQLDGNGSMCVLGALNFAYCGNAVPRTRNSLIALTDTTFSNWLGFPGIPYFNDRIAKNKEEVIETMLKFADEFDPQGGKGGK